MDPDLGQVQDLREQLSEALLLRRLRMTVADHLRPVRRGQCPPIELAVRGEWHRSVKQDDDRRDHVLRQLLADVRAQRRGIERSRRRLCCGHHVPDKPGQVPVGLGDGDGLPHAVMGVEFTVASVSP